jgi:hypothetical protein
MSIHNPAANKKQPGPFMGGGAATAVTRNRAKVVLTRRRLRGETFSLGLLTFLTGGWLIASPWALHYISIDTRVNAWACGGAICVLTLASTIALVQDYLRWFVALIGVWLMVTVITIDVGAASKWNDLVVGFVVFISSAVLWEMVPYMGRPGSVKN